MGSLEKFVHFSKDTYAILRARSTTKFGSLRTYGLGMTVDYGATGTTYKDPRSNMKLCIEIFVWRQLFEASLHWKGAVE